MFSDGDLEERFVRAVERIGYALERMGTNNAATEMGAIEMLAMEIKGVATAIASSSLDELLSE